MKLLSIDVGLKNLALCLFDKNENNEFYINIWDVINITGVEEDKDIVSICGEVIKNNKVCGKNAKYKKGDECLCMKHSKKCVLYPPGLGNLTKYSIKPKALITASSGFVPEYNSSNTQKCVSFLFKAGNIFSPM